ncbi:MAG: ABC transporter permease [Gammaproteobacteria bacterium]
MAEQRYYFFKNKLAMGPATYWDLVALLLIFGVIALLAIGTKQMTVPYHFGQTLSVSLDPGYLPEYALRTVLRMFYALGFSLLFTFIFGAWAAKSKRAGQIIIPMIDILQSVPVLAFLSIAIVGFINLFQGSLLGPEAAAIFVIFTAQAWNMVLSFYQSMRTVPSDLLEVAEMYHLSPWRRFWRVEVPFALPGLLWNTMMSMSASWFFVVACEAITVNNQTISLPGIGSYIALAIEKANSIAVLNAILTMFVVIVLYDQLIFRPLNKWIEKFKIDPASRESPPRTWLTKLLHRSHVIKYMSHFFGVLTDTIVNLPLFNVKKSRPHAVHPKFAKYFGIVWNISIVVLVLLAIWAVIHFIANNVTVGEMLHVILLGLATAARVFAVIIFCTAVWVPIGVWIGQKPRLTQIVQPIIQFLAAFPAYLLFPVVVILIVKFHLNVQIWVTPLMILGTQWYVAFNVIAGTSAIPKELSLAVDSFGVKGKLKWQKFIFPAVFPYYITGAITAVGGAWNTSIVAEVVHWGNTSLTATGLGAYITHYAAEGDYARIGLGITVMCAYVLVLNRLIWRPLYQFAEKRFRLD